MSEVFIPIAGFIMAAITIVGVASQLAGAMKARYAGAQAEDYRRLLQESNEAQRRFSEALDRAVAEIGALRQRSEEMERLLKDVA